MKHLSEKNSFNFDVNRGRQLASHEEGHCLQGSRFVSLAQPVAGNNQTLSSQFVFGLIFNKLTFYLFRPFDTKTSTNDRRKVLSVRSYLKANCNLRLGAVQRNKRGAKKHRYGQTLSCN